MKNARAQTMMVRAIKRAGDASVVDEGVGNESEERDSEEDSEDEDPVAAPPSPNEKRLRTSLAAEI